MQEFEYTIKDEMGLHARPVGMLVKKASSYKSRISIVKGGKRAEADKLFAILGLAVKSGETIKVIVEGNDEVEAVRDFSRFCEENF